ncbi:MAG: hypothetical protein JOZ83_14265, partial [Silvibacterium sp.]|nr:hypothetical protein [Silvibacterium sp.]
MTRYTGKALKCFGVLVCLLAAASHLKASPDTSPVAYVYVSNTPSPSATNYSPHQVVGYSADGEGRLAPLPGSPFNQDVGPMAVNGAYLMAAGGTEPVINSYRILSNGKLAFAAQTNYAEQNENGCGGAGQLFFDRTGHSLYVQEYNIDCANSGTASYAVDVETGMLSYLGETITGAQYNNLNPASFIANNVYAYAAGPGGCFYYQ